MTCATTIVNGTQRTRVNTGNHGNGNRNTGNQNQNQNGNHNGNRNRKQQQHNQQNQGGKYDFLPFPSTDSNASSQTQHVPLNNRNCEGSVQVIDETFLNSNQSEYRGHGMGNHGGNNGNNGDINR